MNYVISDKLSGAIDKLENTNERVVLRLIYSQSDLGRNSEKWVLSYEYSQGS